MTPQEVKYYKEQGSFGRLIVTANVTFLCTYIMYLEFDNLANILGIDYKHSLKHNLKRVYKLLDDMNVECINFYKHYANKVATVTLDICNELEENLLIPNKELYIIMACNEYVHSIQDNHVKGVESIYKDKLNAIYKLLNDNLSNYLNTSYMNVANAVIRNIFNDITYRIDDNGDYVIMRGSNKIN